MHGHAHAPLAQARMRLDQVASAAPHHNLGSVARLRHAARLLATRRATRLVDKFNKNIVAMNGAQRSAAIGKLLGDLRAILDDVASRDGGDGGGVGSGTGSSACGDGGDTGRQLGGRLTRVSPARLKAKRASARHRPQRRQRPSSRCRSRRAHRRPARSPRGRSGARTRRTSGRASNGRR